MEYLHRTLPWIIIGLHYVGISYLAILIVKSRVILASYRKAVLHTSCIKRIIVSRKSKMYCIVNQTANEHLDQMGIVISKISKISGAGGCSSAPPWCFAKYWKWKCIHAENSTMKSIALENILCSLLNAVLHDVRVRQSSIWCLYEGWLKPHRT